MNFDNEPSTSAGVPAQVRRRRFSNAKIQPTRIKKVMQSDEDIGRMVASVPVAIGSAMEHFLEKLLTSAAHCIQFSASRTLSPSHIKQAVIMNPHFKFLESSLADVQPLPKAEGAVAMLPPPTEVAPLVEPPNPYAAVLTSLINATARGVPPGINGVPQASSMFLNQNTLTQQVLAQIAAASTAEKRKAPAPLSAVDPTKPKRGRPRKIKREDKCINEEELVIPAAPEDNKPKVSAQLSDRELMPPPKLPLVRKFLTSEKKVTSTNGFVKTEECRENCVKNEQKSEDLQDAPAKVESAPQEPSSS
ncbi:hypothetical protein QR680_005642 [Steinernema hermaphroditum]|uniref:Transcription factor CBF/NF-Y/archaeal histone domain-containing protein n=1 Tax=Steinernema hermaphroditum TaxID=289476 RepID=A0AA39HST8_9BILA|nr:hypothetical protein QR680_005642 [Steinernema hermaphroditum]